MTASVKLHEPKQSNNLVTQCLQDVLASTTGLYLATHNYHWNVEGHHFGSLHQMFEDQYNELFLALDVIGERIRALDDYALPFEGENILEVSKMISNALNKETDANDRADRMVHNLITLNEAVIKSCEAVKKASVDTGDDESEDLAITRITAHQKALWMLRSSVK